MPLKDNTAKRFKKVTQGLSAAKTAAFDGASNFFNRIRINSNNTGLYERILINNGDYVQHWSDKVFVTGDSHGTPGTFNNTGSMITLQAFNTGANLVDGNVCGIIRGMANNDNATPENTTYADIYLQASDITDGAEQGTVWIVVQDGGSDNFLARFAGDSVSLARGTSAPNANLHTGGSTILGAAASAVADGDLDNGNVNISTSGTTLTFKVKDASGTVRSGTVTLS